MSFPPVVILGCGFTGIRVAKLLLIRGVSVFAATRDPVRLAYLSSAGVKVERWNLDGTEDLPVFPGNAAVLHSVPDISQEQRSRLHEYLRKLRLSRLVYLSTTSVYGSQTDVNAETGIEVAGEKSERRVNEEAFVRNGDWDSMILRPAAIYGPHRGVHTHGIPGARQRPRSAMVSRIHVDDLAVHAESALLANSTGSYPVADERPCSSDEIGEFCRRILRWEQKPAAPQIGEPVQTAGRRVDGSRIREVLGLRLRYPGYDSGTLACIAEETSRGNSV